MLHHYVLRGCTKTVGDGSSTNGTRVSASIASTKCGVHLGAWTPGKSPFFKAPAMAALPIAGLVGLSINVHYTNPAHKTGARDSSGFRMHWTSTPRNESLGRLAPIVLSIDPTIRIPPQNPRYFLTTGCRLEGIEDVGGRGGAPFITLENVWYHAHLLGREMYTELYPAKQAGTTIWQEPRWHFDDQYSVDLHARHVTLRNGDLVQSTCVYVRVRERFCDEPGIPPYPAMACRDD
jgi:hypothetical protein